MIDATKRKVSAAKEASIEIAALEQKIKNSVLLSLADALNEERETIKDANNKDLIESGCRVVILEFTTVQNKFFKPLYTFYITKVLPFIGEVISGKKGAYKYLPDSMLSFPVPEEFKKAMEESDLQDVRYYKLTFGIVAVHVGTVK